MRKLKAPPGLLGDLAVGQKRPILPDRLEFGKTASKRVLGVVAFPFDPGIAQPHEFEELVLERMRFLRSRRKSRSREQRQSQDKKRADHRSTTLSSPTISLKRLRVPS